MLTHFFLFFFISQQAKQCAKTVVAPPPKVIKKVQLPAHFQFFTEQDNKEDHASDHWRKGYANPFKSYQKVNSYIPLLNLIK